MGFVHPKGHGRRIQQMMEPVSIACSCPSAGRSPYAELDDQQLAQQLRAVHGGLLLRGRLETLLMRRLIGALLHEFARRHPRDRGLFEAFARTHSDLGYDEGRRHIQLFVHWDRCLTTLERLDDEAKKEGRRLTVPGLRKLLVMSGVVGRRPAISPPEDADPPEELAALPSAELPNDVAELKRIIRKYEAWNRELRGHLVISKNEAQFVNEEILRLRTARKRLLPLSHWPAPTPSG
jgi:hypothetical protein